MRLVTTAVRTNPARHISVSASVTAADPSSSDSSSIELKSSNVAFGGEVGVTLRRSRRPISITLLSPTFYIFCTIFVHLRLNSFIIFQASHFIFTSFHENNDHISRTVYLHINNVPSMTFPRGPTLHPCIELHCTVCMRVIFQSVMTVLTTKSVETVLTTKSVVTVLTTKCVMTVLTTKRVRLRCAATNVSLPRGAQIHAQVHLDGRVPEMGCGGRSM